MITFKISPNFQPRLSILILGVFVALLGGVYAVGSISQTNQSAAVATASNTCTSVTDGIIDVKKFGAIGDGKANDTTALQTATDCALQKLNDTAPHSVVLYFPTGTYLLSDTLSFASSWQGREKYWQGIVIRGDGSGSSTIIDTGGKGILAISFPVRTPDKPTITIEGLKLLAGKQNSGNAIDIQVPITGAALRRMLNANDLFIGGRSSGDYFNYGMYLVGVRRPLIENVVIEGPRTGGPAGKACVSLESTYTPIINRVTCKSMSVGIDMPDTLWNAQEGFEVTNSNISNVNTGMRLKTVSAEPAGWVFDNTISAIKIGVDLRSKKWVIISGNTFKRTGSSPYVDIAFIGIEESVIQYNKFTGNGTNRTGVLIENGDSEYVEGRTTVTHESFGNTIAHNTFSAFDTHIDIATGVRETDIFDNSFTNTQNIVNKGIGTYIEDLQSSKVTVAMPDRTQTINSGDMLEIQWTDAVIGGKYAVTYTKLPNPDRTYISIIDSAKGGEYTWKTPTTLTSGEYSVQVCRRGGDGIGGSTEDKCDSGDFSVAAGGTKPGTNSYVAITSPKNDIQIPTGQKLTFQWTDSPAGGTYKIQYTELPNTDSKYTLINKSSSGRSHSWTVPENLPTGSYSVQICRLGGDGVGGSVTDKCDSADFTISSKVADSYVVITSPKNGTQAVAGQNLILQWTDPPAGGTYKIQYTELPNTDLKYTLISRSASGRSHSWTVPRDLLAGKYGVQICRLGGDSVGGSASDRCDSKHFYITSKFTP